MADWTFPYFELEFEYPDDQKRIKLGQGYTLATKAYGPLERVYTLKMTGLQWFLDAAGDVDRTQATDRNIALVMDFYEAQRMDGEWTIDLPGHGTKTVRFNKPLKIPASMKGGAGVLPEFEIELIEVP